MAEHRGTALVLLAFAVSLAGLGLGAGLGYARCGGGSDCSYQLALSIVAFAPAALVAALVALLMRARAGLRWLRSLMLMVGVGLAIAPLAAFVLRDVWAAPLFAALVALLLLLLLVAEREEGVEVERRPEEAPAAPREGAAPPLEPGRRRPPAASRVDRAIGVMGELAVLNVEILRLSERLPRIDRRRLRGARDRSAWSNARTSP